MITGPRAAIRFCILWLRREIFTLVSIVANEMLIGDVYAQIAVNS